jgi:hypothetical protein
VSISVHPFVVMVTAGDGRRRTTVRGAEMAKYVLTYRGGGEMPGSQAERDAVMAAWTQWFGGLGSAVTEVGNPFGASSTVAANGVSEGTTSGVNGYSVLEAADLPAAVELAKGCPILTAGGSVEVHEALAM